MEKQVQDTHQEIGRPNAINEQKKETIMYAVNKLLETNPEIMIGNLEYMIGKITTHPDLMQEVDFQAAKSGQEIVCFLRSIGTTI